MITSTDHPVYADPADTEAGIPQRDERTPGVHLLDFDAGEEWKRTAELIDREYWLITEWETFDIDGGTYWMPGYWNTITIERVETLARLQALELDQPPAEQGALDLDQQA